MRASRADVVVGGAWLALGVVTVVVWPDGLWPRVTAAVAGVALAASPRFPAATWAFVSALTLACAARGTILGADDFPALLLLTAHAFSAGRWDPRWHGVGGPLALAASAEVASSAWDGGTAPGIYAIFIAGAWVGGRALRARQQAIAELDAGIRELEREQAAYARVVAHRERERIAAELHDVVAHAITLMVIQAGAGRRLVARDPDGAREALAAIAGAAREAESDLSRLAALLAGDRVDGGASDLAGVEHLVATAASRGLDVRLRRHGGGGVHPAATAALGLRVVQEGITNALRHAPGSSVEVIVRDGEGLELSVLNGPSRDPAPPQVGSGGLGLRGLRERIDALGGTLEAGPRPDGGWCLRARLSRAEEAVAGPPPAPR